MSSEIEIQSTPVPDLSAAEPLTEITKNFFQILPGITY